MGYTLSQVLWWLLFSNYILRELYPVICIFNSNKRPDKTKASVVIAHRGVYKALIFFKTISKQHYLKLLDSICNNKRIILYIISSVCTLCDVTLSCNIISAVFLLKKMMTEYYIMQLSKHFL